MPRTNHDGPEPAAGLAPIALTQGDPSGIGPDISLLAWSRRQAGDLPFYLIADPDHVRRRAASIGIKVDVAEVEPEEATHAFARALPVVAVGGPVAGEPGLADPQDAPWTIAAIELGVAHVRAGRASAIVTNPITKASLYRAGFSHPGHTEFLGELAGRHFGDPGYPVMMLWSPQLAVVPVTIHVALRAAIDLLTTDMIVRAAQVTAQSLADRFGVAAPRLAISGLNPHAGEQGAMGAEDDAIIRPAVERLRAMGIQATGPLPADSMFHAHARANYDAAICMYHDQALIPIKTLAFDSAVNVTLGLPFVRTSPDHGAAYDIAGKGTARPDSLIAALQLASRLSARQERKAVAAASRQ